MTGALAYHGAMRWRGFVVMVLTGCNAVFGLDPVAGADDGAMIDAAPDDGTQSIDARVIDARVIDASCPADSDCDGIFNINDNCPAIANSDQHDEDDDSHGDLCDNCPHVANVLQQDDTEAVPDDVGNACDPHPLASDRLVLFEPFTDVTAAQWQLVGTGLHIVDDDLHFPGDLPQRAALRRNFPPSNGQLHVSTGFAVAQVPPFDGPNSARAIAVLMGSSSTAVDGRTCVFDDDAAVGMVATLSARVTGNTITTAALGPMAVDEYTMAGHTAPSGSVGNQALKCWVRGNVGWPGETAIELSDAGPFMTGTVGVASIRVAARFHYLIVYEHVTP